jgi:hypothetical protein
MSQILRRGCVLTAVNRDAHPQQPDEMQSIWEKALQ